MMFRLGEHFLTLVDVGTRYKEAEVLTSKDSKEDLNSIKNPIKQDLLQILVLVRQQNFLNC